MCNQIKDFLKLFLFFPQCHNKLQIQSGPVIELNTSYYSGKNVPDPYTAKKRDKKMYFWTSGAQNHD